MCLYVGIKICIGTFYEINMFNIVYVSILYLNYGYEIGSLKFLLKYRYL